MSEPFEKNCASRPPALTAGICMVLRTRRRELRDIRAVSVFPSGCRSYHASAAGQGHAADAVAGSLCSEALPAQENLGISDVSASFIQGVYKSCRGNIRCCGIYSCTAEFSLAIKLVFIVGPERMSKCRFIIKSLLPGFVLGVIPYISFLTHISKNSPILFRWWDELPPSGFEKNRVFRKEHLFDSPGRGIIISAAVTIQSK